MLKDILQDHAQYCEINDFGFANFRKMMSIHYTLINDININRLQNYDVNAWLFTK